MTVKAFENLLELTNRLEPHMRLKLDWIAFEHYFGNPDSKAAREEAMAFAERNHLILYFDDGKQSVELGRPYFNRDNDA